MKKILFYNFVTTFLLLLLWFFVHHYRVSQLSYARDLEQPNSLFSEEQLIQIGWVEPRHQSSHFENFKVQNDSKNKIRIGVFGESYAAGSEVGPNSDFPSLLQKILDSISPNKYEVLNFASGSYGFTQAHLMYKFVEKKFGLDIIIFLTLDLNAIRDQNLVYPQAPGTHPIKGPVHARYYLEDNQVKLLKIIGRNRKEANDLFNSFFFPLSYLKYNFFLPPFLRSLLPYQVNYRTNPFYYDQRYSSLESYTIYEKIFQQMSEENQSRKILAITNIQYLLDNKRTSNNLFFIKFNPFKLAIQNDFLYKAPCCHLSPLGNFELAKRAATGLFSNRIIDEPAQTNKPDWNPKRFEVDLNSAIINCPKSEDLENLTDIVISTQNNVPMSRLLKTYFGKVDDNFLVTSPEEINYSVEFKDKNIIFFSLPSVKRLMAIKIDNDIELNNNDTFEFAAPIGEQTVTVQFQLIQLGKSIYFAKNINGFPVFNGLFDNTHSFIDGAMSKEHKLSQLLGVRFFKSNSSSTAPYSAELVPKSNNDIFTFRSVQQYDELLTKDLKIKDLFLTFKSKQTQQSCKLFDVSEADINF